MLLVQETTSVLGEIRQYLESFGPLNGLLILFFIFGHYWIWNLYNKNIRGKQAEINRMAQDIKDYREYFMNILNIKTPLK